jgi:Cu(I)/Ag(I) efflux system membrane fusion protein/cobalt-zinc-cadmium efflux system membrane fusion protein
MGNEMKIKKSILLDFLAIVISSGLLISCGSDDTDLAKGEEGQLWTCGMHPEVILDEPGQCPKCGMNLVPLKTTEVVTEHTGAEKSDGERKVKYWQAPMNPSEIYDKPGKSAMGMDLIPVYEDQVSSGSAVQIDPVTVQNMGVRTASVERTDFNRSIRTIGKIDYNEENIFIVSSKISGWIEKLYVDYTGKLVRKGQPLLEIYSPELVTTQQEYLLALKNKELIGETQFASIREGAESLLNSTRQRLLYWDIPESAIKGLEESGEVSKTLKLESPANGVVVHKNAIEGVHIKEGTSLYQIADLSTIWVFVSIYDNELPWVKVGQKATMELSYSPGKVLEGKVVYIYPYLDEKARDVKVRLEFNNPGLELKPGMYSNVWLDSQAIENAIVVPSEAVIRSGQRNLVFVTRGEGRFEPREVSIGEESDDGKIRIISGLMENEEVVISAQFLLDSESRLQEAIQKMLQEKARGGKKTQSADESNAEYNHSNTETTDDQSEMKMAPEKQKHDESMQREKKNQEPHVH